MAKNVEMTIKQVDGSYETIYPQTLVENISDLSTNLYTKNELLSSDTCELYGKNTPDEILSAIANSSSSWTLIQSYTTAGSYQFIVPEGVTKIGVYLRGGGGGGGFQIVSQSRKYGASGGGSGYCRNITMDVIPGQQINAVVGAKGVGGNQNSSRGTAGGSTSFGSFTVEGGEGGYAAKNTNYVYRAKGSQSSFDINLASNYIALSGFLYGVANADTDQIFAVESINKFNPFLGPPYAGGGAYYYGSSSSLQTNEIYQKCPPLVDGTHGGSGWITANSNGEDAVGCGNGGGGLVSSGYYTAGSGADGGIWIYTQGVR